MQLLLQVHPAAAQEKNPDGWQALHLAVREMGGRGEADLAECVRLLLQAYPAAAREKTPERVLPLHLAARHMGGGLGAVKCMRMLLLAHPEAIRQTTPDGFLPLHLLAENEARPPVLMVRLLVAAFPEALCARDANGLTPLQAAMHWKSLPADALAEMQRWATKGEKGGAVDRRRARNASVSGQCSDLAPRAPPFLFQSRPPRSPFLRV